MSSSVRSYHSSAQNPPVTSTSLRAKVEVLDVPGGPVVKNPPANAGHMGLFPDPGRSHMPQGN